MLTFATALILLLFALLTAAAVRWIYSRPQRGLLLVAALVPLDGLIAVLPLPGVLSGWKEATLVVTLACGFLRFRRLSPARARTVPVHMPWWPILGILIVFGSVSALVVFGLYGLFAIKVTFFYVIVLAVLWLAPFDANDRDSLVTIIMSMGVLTSVWGLIQQALGPGTMIELGFEYGRQVRFAGGMFRTFSTFNQPFPFALFVMFALLIGGAVALAHPRRIRNALFLCCTPLMILAMGTAIVRAAILGLVVGVLWLALHRFRRLLYIFAAAAVAALVIIPFVPGRLVQALGSSSSLDERFDRWGAILGSVFHHPLGKGLGSSGSAADAIDAARGQDLGLISPNYQPDNYYFKILYELGPIGLWLFAGFLIAALLWTLRLSRKLRTDDAALVIGVSASIAAAIVASTLATYFEIFPMDFYFWLFLGVAGCAAAQTTSPTAPWPSGRAAAVSKRMRGRFSAQSRINWARQDSPQSSSATR